MSNAAGFASLALFSALLIPRYVMSGAGLAATLSFTVAAMVLFVFFMADTKTKYADLVPNRNDWNQILNRFKNREPRVKKL